MKKIMFNDKHGLTQAVLEGRKTMTRRIIPIKLIQKYGHNKFNDRTYELIRHCTAYQSGEEVAVAQSYKDCGYNGEAKSGWCHDENENHIDVHFKEEAGWTNKMFVRADRMKHRIRITNIKVERLKDISDEDCMKEGIMNKNSGNHRHKKAYPFYFAGGKHVWDNSYSTPRQAFAALIDKVSGKGTWENNPWVFVYSFEKID